MCKVQSLVYGDLIIDAACLFARRDGKTIQFTRNERALLLMLSRNPHRLMSRSQLIDAIPTSDTELSDRNVDFLINRIRIKLGDSARAPKYIATQYGEGYVWIAERSVVAATAPDLRATDGLLAIKPIIAAEEQPLHKRASAFVSRLRESIAAKVDADQAVVVDEHPSIGRFRYVLEVSFHTSDSRTNGAATLREIPSRHIVNALRLDLRRADVAALKSEAARVSQVVADTLRKASVDATKGLGTPTDQPLEIRLRKASVLLSSSNPKWLERGHQLNAARAADPANADLALQWCLHLFARLVLDSPFKCMSLNDRNMIESEIEATALDHLPAVEANPLLMVTAAKLLYFINRGHLDLAEDLAERAYARAADFVAAIPILGQLRQVRGRFSEAISFFDRGIELAAADSDLLLYLQVLKCIALLASGDRTGLDNAAIFSRNSPHCPPDIMMLIELTFPAVNQPLPQALAEAWAKIGPNGARSALTALYFTSARQHISVDARANVMRGLLHRAISLHGPKVVPAFIRSEIGMMAG